MRWLKGPVEWGIRKLFAQRDACAWGLLYGRVRCGLPDKQGESVLLPRPVQTSTMRL